MVWRKNADLLKVFAKRQKIFWKSLQKGKSFEKRAEATAGLCEKDREVFKRRQALWEKGRSNSWTLWKGQGSLWKKAKSWAKRPMFWEVSSYGKACSRTCSCAKKCLGNWSWDWFFGIDYGPFLDGFWDWFFFPFQYWLRPLQNQYQILILKVP